MSLELYNDLDMGAISFDHRIVNFHGTESKYVAVVFSEVITHDSLMHHPIVASKDKIASISYELSLSTGPGKKTAPHALAALLDMDEKAVKHIFNGKMVLIGVQDDDDRHTLNLEKHYGFMVQAHIINQLLGHNLIHPMQRHYEFVILLLACILAFGSRQTRHPRFCLMISTALLFLIAVLVYQIGKTVSNSMSYNLAMLFLMYKHFPPRKHSP